MRRAMGEEEAIVRDSLNAVDRDLYERFCSGKSLAVVDDDEGPIMVLVDEEVFGLPEELLYDAYGGLPIGRLTEDGFAFELQGAVIFARETRKQTVTVQELASHHFLYGKDVFGENILGFDPTLKTGEHCIVTNPRHEAIGIGLVVGRFKGNRPAVQSIHDLGSYLRDQ